MQRVVQFALTMLAVVVIFYTREGEALAAWLLDPNAQ